MVVKNPGGALDACGTLVLEVLRECAAGDGDRCCMDYLYELVSASRVVWG